MCSVDKDAALEAHTPKEPKDVDDPTRSGKLAKILGEIPTATARPQRQLFRNARLRADRRLPANPGPPFNPSNPLCELLAAIPRRARAASSEPG
jgi:hypothetical protein